MRTLATLLAVVAGALLLTSSGPRAACANVGCVAVSCLDSSACIGDCFCFHEGPGMGVCVSTN